MWIFVILLKYEIGIFLLIFLSCLFFMLFVYCLLSKLRIPRLSLPSFFFSWHSVRLDLDFYCMSSLGLFASLNLNPNAIFLFFSSDDTLGVFFRLFWCELTGYHHGMRTISYPYSAWILFLFNHNLKTLIVG